MRENSKMSCSNTRRKSSDGIEWVHSLDRSFKTSAATLTTAYLLLLLLTLPEWLLMKANFLRTRKRHSLFFRQSWQAWRISSGRSFIGLNRKLEGLRTRQRTIVVIMVIPIILLCKTSKQ
jgi:hypothetical protein